MLHVIQNDPEVPLGNYAQALNAFGVNYRTVSAFAGESLPSVESCAGLVVLGGAMGVHETAKHPFLLEVKGLIRDCLAQDIPYLGLCLGGQLLAEVAGARVISNRWEESGTLPVHLTAEGEASPLFNGIPTPFFSFQWHHDSFDIPEGGTLLASSPACPHQAFSLGSTAFGLQFHPEMLDTVIDDWCRWEPATLAVADEMLKTFRAVQQEYLAASWQLLENFLVCGGILRGDQA